MTRNAAYVGHETGRVAQLTSLVFVQARGERYCEIERMFNRVTLLISVLSVVYCTLAFVLIETAWDATKFDTDSTAVLAMQCALTFLSLVICAAVYCESILFKVNDVPGLSLSVTTKPDFSWWPVLELCWNLLTSYPGTTPMLALPVCVLRVLYLLKLLRFAPQIAEARRFALEAAVAPDHRTSSSLKLMLRKRPFPLITIAMFLLVPLLGYLLLASQRLAANSGLAVGTKPSWAKDESIQLADSVWAVLFMIAISEPYEVYDNLADRVLAFLTAVIAAVFTTMLITSLMQLIEADSATEAALADAAQKRCETDIRSAAGELIRVQWKVHTRGECMTKSSKEHLVDLTTSCSHVVDPQERELFKQLLVVKQNFRACLRRKAEMNDDVDVASAHAKMQSLLNQGNHLTVWLKQFKEELFCRLIKQDTERQQQFDHEEGQRVASLQQMEQRLDEKQVEMETRLNTQRVEMEDRLTKLLNAHAHEMRQMELRIHMSEEQRDEANIIRAERLHLEEIERMLEIEAREKKQNLDLHNAELKVSMDLEAQREAHRNKLHQDSMGTLKSMEQHVEIEQEKRAAQHQQEMEFLQQCTGQQWQTHNVEGNSSRGTMQKAAVEEAQCRGQQSQRHNAEGSSGNGTMHRAAVEEAQCRGQQGQRHDAQGSSGNGTMHRAAVAEAQLRLHDTDEQKETSWE